MNTDSKTRYTEQDLTRLTISTGREALNNIGIELNLDNKRHIKLLSQIQSSLITIITTEGNK